MTRTTAADRYLAEVIRMPQAPGVLIRRVDLYNALRAAGFSNKRADEWAFVPVAADDQTPHPAARRIAQSFATHLKDHTTCAS